MMPGLPPGSQTHGSSPLSQWWDLTLGTGILGHSSWLLGQNRRLGARRQRSGAVRIWKGDEMLIGELKELGDAL